MIYYNETDPLCCAWLRILIAANLLPEGHVDERSIKEVNAKDLKSYTQCHFFAGIGVWPYALHQANWGERPVWTGSCPCQPFSVQGQQRGIRDPRHLWPVWSRLIRKCRPDTVFGEQVATKNGHSWFDIVSTDLERQGYAVGACNTYAGGFGAPHIRQRLYFAARMGDPDSGRQMEQSQGTRRKTGNAGTRNEGLANATLQRLERAKLQRTLGIIKQPCNSGVGHFVRGDKETSSQRWNTKGFWGDVEWIASKNGTKERPVEPGSFPLAYGAPEGVGLVRGFGNALCAPQAQGFIEAFINVNS